MADPKETLKQWCTSGKLHKASLSNDGATLSLNNDNDEDGTTTTTTTTTSSSTNSLNGKDIITVTNEEEGKEVQYSLASIYLQIVDPNQSLPKYRIACKKYNVADAVKALDKPLIVGYFLGEETGGSGGAQTTTTTSAQTADTAAAAVKPHPAAAVEDDDKANDTNKEVSSSDRKRSREHHKHDKHRKDKKKSSSKDRASTSSSSSKHEKIKKSKSLVTNEEIFSNLNVVVGKRTMEGDENIADHTTKTATTTADKATVGATTTTGDATSAAAADLMSLHPPKNAELEAIRLALSTEGFAVTQELLESAKEAAQIVMAHEIPVGDSASILRASAVGANLTRVLNLFTETVNPSKAVQKKNSASRGGGGGPASSSLSSSAAALSSKKTFRPYLVGKKPIILLPKGMTAPLTILNAYDFFANARFIPRDVMMKNKSLQVNAKKTTFSHKVQGLGQTVEFELLDNTRKLTDRREWERVVAVVVLGHKWQFKDWPGLYKDPVQLFSMTFGFYIGMEGEKVSTDLEGWSCQRGFLHRDKRGMDSVTNAAFWNSLDQWMKIHRPELLPQPENS